jgi:hypothetical protein
MDPTSNLKEAITLAQRLLTARDKNRVADPDDADRLAELVCALHDWLCRGGFLPRQWQRQDAPLLPMP